MSRASEQQKSEWQNLEPHPLNAPGPFFVERGMCILCLQPVHAAPSLMDVGGSGKDEGCYFSRQPETSAEVDAVVSAVQASCCGAVLYGGTDKSVLARLAGEPGAGAV